MHIINQVITRMRNKKYQKVKAFTLLETLISLFIVCCIIVLFEATFQKTLHLIRGELFVQQFENELKHQQFQAVTRAEVRTITATDNVVKMNHIVLQVPEEVLFSDFDITFNATGNIKSIKHAKIIITLPYAANKQIIYQLQLGSGQYKKTTS